jgi:hypothetical protein
MTRAANARLAGFTYLFYIAVAFPNMVLFERATRGADITAKLASIAQHATDLRVGLMLSLLSGLSAIVLAVTLHALTRVQDADLALLGFTCRVAEGITGVATLSMTLGLLWLATAVGPDAPDPAGARTLAGFVLKDNFLVAASLFAVGSTVFCWLLLRGRMIPRWLAWLGFVGSAVLVVAVPLQLAQFLTGPVTQLMWIPIAIFEITVAVWWLIKGDTTPAAR